MRFHDTETARAWLLSSQPSLDLCSVAFMQLNLRVTRTQLAGEYEILAASAKRMREATDDLHGVKDTDCKQLEIMRTGVLLLETTPDAMLPANMKQLALTLRELCDTIRGRAYSHAAEKFQEQAYWLRKHMFRVCCTQKDIAHSERCVQDVWDRRLAFAMVLHPRLSLASPMRDVDSNVVAMIMASAPDPWLESYMRTRGLM